MNKEEIITELKEKHQSFTDYISGLSADEYLFSYQGKWSAAQQIAHIVLCVKPLVQVFNMGKPAIEQAFGKTDRNGRTYEALHREYIEKLSDGGKAPERYVPANDTPSTQSNVCDALLKLADELCAKIDECTEHDLDTYLIPHPLLGKLTLREMLYNAIYHVQHHHEQAKETLISYTAVI